MNPELPDPTGLDALFTITCGQCARTNQLTAWRQVIWGPLPHEHYQCPACGHAFARKVNPNYQHWYDKPIVCETVPSQLTTQRTTPHDDCPPESQPAVPA